MTSTEKDFSFGKTNEYILVNGKIIKSMESVLISGKMVEFMSGSTQMI